MRVTNIQGIKREYKGHWKVPYFLSKNGFMHDVRISNYGCTLEFCNAVAITGGAFTPLPAKQHGPAGLNTRKHIGKCPFHMKPLNPYLRSRDYTCLFHRTPSHFSVPQDTTGCLPRFQDFGRSYDEGGPSLATVGRGGQIHSRSFCQGRWYPVYWSMCGLCKIQIQVHECIKIHVCSFQWFLRTKIWWNNVSVIKDLIRGQRANIDLRMPFWKLLRNPKAWVAVS